MKKERLHKILNQINEGSVSFYFHMTGISRKTLDHKTGLTEIKHLGSYVLDYGTKQIRLSTSDGSHLEEYTKWDEVNQRYRLSEATRTLLRIQELIK